MILRSYVSVTSWLKVVNGGGVVVVVVVVVVEVVVLKINYVRNV